MYLIIDEFGTFIGKKQNRFEIKSKNKFNEICADNVDQIILVHSSSISSEAIKLAIEKNIDVVFLGDFGMPIARVYPCKLGGTTLTRRLQVEAFFNEKGNTIIYKLINAKLKNQAYFLKSIIKTRKNISSLNLIADEILSCTNQIPIKGVILENREIIFGIEGICAKKYFDCLKEILPFTKRQHKGMDAVNNLLNYGYGILYSEVERACMLSGLDPYFGYLHSDRYNKPSLVLDIIEEFRQPIVDRAVLTLFSQKQIKEEDFEVVGENNYLSKSGRKKLISQIMDRLSSELTYQNNKTSMKNIILDQCRQIVSFLHDKSEFEPFVYRW